MTQTTRPQRLKVCNLNKITTQQLMNEFDYDYIKLTDDLPLLVDQLSNELLRTLDTVAPEKEVSVSIQPK